MTNLSKYIVVVIGMLFGSTFTKGEEDTYNEIKQKSQPQTVYSEMILVESLTIKGICWSTMKLVVPVHSNLYFVLKDGVLQRKEKKWIISISSVRIIIRPHELKINNKVVDYIKNI